VKDGEKYILYTRYLAGLILDEGVGYEGLILFGSIRDTGEFRRNS